MADKLTPAQRSWNMSRIRGKDTRIEVKVRRYLFSKGFRYRKNVATLPGKPDIVFSQYKTVIFIHGCYWHRHEGCKNCTTPGTNRNFWLQKFEKTVQNDQKQQEQLKQSGWKVFVLWECQIENDFDALMAKLITMLKPPDQPG